MQHMYVEMFERTLLIVDYYGVIVGHPEVEYVFLDNLRLDTGRIVQIE